MNALEFIFGLNQSNLLEPRIPDDFSTLRRKNLTAQQTVRFKAIDPALNISKLASDPFRKEREMDGARCIHSMGPDR
jgi:hypothetical protein